MTIWFKIKLWKRILSALVLGVLCGLIWGPDIQSIAWVGDVFIRLIRMLIVPLIFTTLVSGIVAMGDPKKLGTIGAKAVGLYLATTTIAIVIGLVVATILQPGDGVDLTGVSPKPLGPTKSMGEQLLELIPINPVGAMANGEVLPVMLFSVLIGIGIILAGDRGKPLGELFNSAAEVVLKITHLVMEVAPFGVFALISVVTGTKGIEALFSILNLVIAVYGGCLFHILCVQGGLIKFILGLPTGRFFRGSLDAQLVAYSTASSAATLPVTMTVAEENLGIKPPVAASVLPLGATINMDGAAIYVCIVTLFTTQVFNIDLAWVDYFMIAITTIMISVGAAAVPSATLFLLAAVLGVVGVTDTQIALVIGFVLPFDRILDMMRTATNVTSDLAVATAVGKWEDELDIAVFMAPPRG